MVQSPTIFDEWRDKSAHLFLLKNSAVAWSSHDFPPYGNADHELGAKIAAGDKVLLSYASANHDERHFPDPDVFDPDRKSS